MLFFVLVLSGCTQKIENDNINDKEKEIKKTIENDIESNNELGNLGEIKLSDPEWKEFYSESISFKYPKTFCKTSWQEDWDVSSCDKEYKVKQGDDGLISIFPPYSSFGFEFGGDIVISFINKDDFNEIKDTLQTEENIQNKYIVYSRKGIFGHPGKIDEYFLIKNIENVGTQKGKLYIKIKNYFPKIYPRYIKYLLESIK